jgi:alkylation response protein AidB-like acyl-CoA dehydrogenase
MDFDLSEDQHLLMTAVEGLLESYAALPTGPHGYALYSDELQGELGDSGFLGIASEKGFGPLEAALLVEAVAASPNGVEVAASALVGPLLDRCAGPVAIAWGSGRPVRYLEEARTLCVIEGDSVVVGTPSADDIRPVRNVAAYPMAVLGSMPANAKALDAATAAAVRRRAVLGIAVEAAGLMRAALETTVQFVKDRQQFGQPLGHFQAIQHRLAECAQMVRAARSLALRAAYLDDDRNAAIACLYAQEAMRKVIYDCHQFSGAMGLTLEFPLHLWTFRLKVLQGEAGGRAAQGLLAARTVWNDHKK